MLTIAFICLLGIQTYITNHHFAATTTANNLKFSKRGNIILLVCFLISILFDIFSQYYGHYYLWFFISLFCVECIAVIYANYNRHEAMKAVQEGNRNIFDSCKTMLRRGIKYENLDQAHLPWTYKVDSKKRINYISFDTTEEGHYDEETLGYVVTDLNKMFDSFQWISSERHRERHIIFKGLPKPPSIAEWPGSDYRPGTWVPVGLSGEGEVCWNMIDDKNYGSSLFKGDDGKYVKTVESPMSPHLLVVGSTGGGKAIWVDQPICVIR